MSKDDSTTADPRARAARLALPALFAALTAAGAFIAIPLPGIPVPIVIQNMIAVLSGLLLGPLRGAAALLLFLILGALGFPVFSGGHGGLAWLAGPTGGYLVGYLFAALVAGLLSNKRSALFSALASLSGFIIIYVLGVVRLKLFKGLGWAEALALGVVPFLIADTVKAIIVAFLGWRLGPFVDRVAGRRASAGDS